MKKIFTLIVCGLAAATAALAQAPNKFGYQAVVRNSSGIVVPNGTSVSFRFTIRDGSSGGTIIYRETQNKTTNNAFGLVNLEVGGGTVVQGVYPNGTQWGSGAKFLQIEVDPAGGSSFTDMGTVQMISVPYANFSGTSANLTGNVLPSQIMAGGASNGQLLSFNGTNWVPVNSAWITSGNDIYNSNSGNVGIGTNTPSSKFSVGEKFLVDGNNGSVSLMDQNSSIMFANPASNSTPAQMYHYLSGTENFDRWIFQHSSGLPNFGLKYSDSFDIYEFRGGGEKSVITLDPSDNYLGIGTRFPNSNIDILNLTSNATVTLRSNFNAASSRLALFNDGGASLSISKGGSATGATINNWSTNNLALLNNGGNGSMMLNTADSIGLATNSFVAMRIKKTGQVMIAGTANHASAGHLYVDYKTYNSTKPAFEINGTNSYLAFRDGSTFKGYIQQNGDLMKIQSFSGELTLGANNAENARFDKNGNFEIGSTAANSHKMWVYDNTANSGSHYAILAEMSSTSQSAFQTAVWGLNRGTGGNGVGVGGVHAAGGFGLYGSAGTGGYAVFASTPSSSDFAFYGVGKGLVTGSFSKASGTFKIDHPQDPENKWLYHSFVESPDMMNIYNGIITTDAEGLATVTMPSYFEALNMDFRYQLTVVGVFAQAIIDKKMENNTFKIRTDKPNVEVSWQVTGVRHDRWAEENRVIPEVQKTGDEIGKYQNPEVFGQPDSKRYVPGQGAHGIPKIEPVKAQPVLNDSFSPGSINR